jgi:putative colanic acid biosynthesis UDP-glucose lipid carrier transferase
MCRSDQNGPRSALWQAFAERISPIRERHGMKPGISGWAQVNGCSGESNKVMRQRIECDRHYIENWSLLLDIKIIFMTLFSKSA